MVTDGRREETDPEMRPDGLRIPSTIVLWSGRFRVLGMHTGRELRELLNS